MVKAPSIKMQLYLFEGLLFLRNQSYQDKSADQKKKLYCFLHEVLENQTRFIRSCMYAIETNMHVIEGTTIKLLDGFFLEKKCGEIFKKKLN